jgi:EAL domain-containing protein (putative c-di-GMP-specific phosphodiesterase class I)
MVRRSLRALSGPGTVLLVASDPLVIAAARDAARRLSGQPPVHVTSGADALTQLVGPGLAPRHLVLEGGAMEAAGPALLTAARDRFSGTGVVVVTRPGVSAPAGLRSVQPDASRLAAALSASAGAGPCPESGPAALEAGLSRGEITVRFQPIVRMADRRPVLLEALARWERPEAALGAGAFIPMAEAAGLGAALTLAVARRALAELAALPAAQRLRMSFNIPLDVLLHPDLPSWLAEAAAAAGLGPDNLLLELTESTAVRDLSALRRALLRLSRRGFGVMLDDLALHDGRRRLLTLPFAGVKLDRGLVLAMPASLRARAEVRLIVREASRRGMVVIAEGVTDPHVWRAAATAGCDLAQGFGIGRPLPASALTAWMAAWHDVALR